MKLTINKLINFLSVGAIILAFSCQELELGNDFLSKPPELGYTLDSVFSNSERAKMQLWNAYSTLPFGLTTSWGNRQVPGHKGGIGHAPRWVITDLFNPSNHFGKEVDSYVLGLYDATFANLELSGENTQGSYADKYGWLRNLGWEGIRDSWVFIENIDRVPDMEQSEKELLKAEAKLIIATHYVQLFRHFGGILYVDKAYTANDDDALERLTVMESVDAIRALIDEALPLLPFELEDPELWSGRWTAAGAMALKVKLLSFAAAPLFNSDEPYMPASHQAVADQLVWTGGYKVSLWQELHDVCKELIQKVEGSSYGMLNTGNPRMDYRDAYYSRSNETLISTRRNFRFNAQMFQTADMAWESWQKWGITTPLHNFVEMYPMKNGMSIKNPASGYDPEAPFYERDPRFYEMFVVTGMEYQGRKAEVWIGGRDRQTEGLRSVITGYKQFKWGLDADLGGHPTDYILQWPFFRLPELYLTYAEALNELNNGPTDEAFKYANKTRERVGVGPIEDYIGKSRGAITKDEFLEALLAERALELACEDVRWYDMVRHKMEWTFTTPQQAMDMTLTEKAEAISGFSNFFQNNIDYNNQSEYFDFKIYDFDYHTKYWQNNFSPKWYLSAFPADEVQKGYGLIQNPGWEF